MKHLAITLVFLLAGAFAFGQRQLEGTVLDSRSQKPIAGAKVTAGAFSATTQTDGTFIIRNYPEEGKIQLNISAKGYKDDVFKITALTGGLYKLKAVNAADKPGKPAKGTSYAENQPRHHDAQKDEDFDLDDDEDMGYGGQSVTGLQTQANDVYDRNAGYNLGFAYFRPRGYDNQYNNVYINGALMNDAENGRATWSEWGGLNDAVRSKEVVSGLKNNNFGFGALGGEQNINMRASAISKQHKVTYSIGNTSYTHRLMYTFGTGLMPNGWAVSLSLSGRYGVGLVADSKTGIRVPGFTEGYTNTLVSNGGVADGLAYKSLGYYFSFEKRFMGTGHSLSFVAFGSPTRRTTQGGSFQEVYDLVGTSYYNGNWGYQNGKIRSAKERTMILPTFQLVWDYEKNNTTLNTVASYQFGRYGTTALNWYDAPDPRPDYYRYLPSYYMENDPDMAAYITDLWQSDPSKSQINWDALYEANYTQNQVGKQAKYVLEDRRNDVNDFNLSSVLNHRFNDRSKITGGIRVRNSISHNFKTIDDLLGGKYWVDIDQYGERDFSANSNEAQNDLDKPNRVVKEGDIYGYNYDMHLVYEELFATANFEFPHWDYYAGLQVSNSNFWRYGYMRNGRAESQGVGSKGKGQTHSFWNYGAKLGATWKINGKNFIYANARVQSRAPFIRNAYISPRVKDVVAGDLKNETDFSVDLSYVLRTPIVTGRVTLYHTMVFDAMESFGFYHDDYRTYVNYTLSDMDMVYQGVEFGVEVKIIPSLTATLIGNYGNYRYTSNPKGTVSAENGTFADQTNEVYYKNYHVTGTPQTAASFGLNYQAPHNIYLSANVNYVGRNYLSMNPERRTQNAVIGVPVEDKDLLNKIVGEERLDGGVTLDLSIGKSFRFKGCSLNLNASVSNVTNNKNIKTGGYEQRRFDYYGLNVDKYPPRYFYANGLTFYISANVRF